MDNSVGEVYWPHSCSSIIAWFSCHADRSGSLHHVGVVCKDGCVLYEISWNTPVESLHWEYSLIRILINILSALFCWTLTDMRPFYYASRFVFSTVVQHYYVGWRPWIKHILQINLHLLFNKQTKYLYIWHYEPLTWFRWTLSWDGALRYRCIQVAMDIIIVLLQDR